MNASLECQIGLCHMIDKSCTPLLVMASNGSQPNMEVDLDGCQISQTSTVEYLQYRQFSKFMGIIIVLVGTLGILGNILSIAVFMAKEMQNCFHKLLIALNLSDI